MKSVAIIGAGASGLVSIKCCLEEGLKPTCFERMNYIGGLWQYTEEIEEGQACVMKSTVTNTSKEMMCFSDFPMPDHYPMYMHSDRVMEYFHLYADKFKLKEHIQLQTEVLNISKSENFCQSGRWNIKVKTTVTGEIKDLVFDAVMVCTGHHAQKNVPDFPGLSEFKGKVLHTHDYKNPKDFHGKKVLVVGIGNSGGDVAVELSHVTSQVYVSTRRGRWIVPRLIEKGWPLDMTNSTRFSIFLLGKFPKLISTLAEREINKRFDHELYSLQPQYRFKLHQVTLNDLLPHQIACGSVIVKCDIQKFTENGVIFTDGTCLESIDAVVLATGYKCFSFPFIDKTSIEFKEREVNMYKMVFPPDLEKPTLCVIGYVQAPGAVIPLSEMQARLATRVIKGDINLPPKEEMWREVNDRQQTILEQHVKSEINPIQVNYINYMDELSEIHGSKPKFGDLFMTDPKLAFQCIFGPCTPFQFRLYGPGSWSGAREAIRKQWERTFQSLRTRQVSNRKEQSYLGIYLTIFIVLIAIFVFLL